MTADAAERVLQDEITAAQEALLGLASQEPDRWWTPRELRIEARNGWSSGAMGLALAALVDDGRLEQRHDFRVRFHS